MSDPMSVYLRLSPIAFVARYGYWVALGWLSTGMALLVAAFALTDNRGWRMAMGAFALVALFGGIRELRRAARKAIAFAVDYRGIYFGEALHPVHNSMSGWVNWADITKVEVFRERSGTSRNASVYRCVGVRTRQANAYQLLGIGDPVERPSALNRLARRLAKVPSPDADGTYRTIYRRMEGWRADPQRIREAVAKFAPELPVEIQ
jgi:hypothetical protein